jgi:hypothetical protein
MPRLPPIENPQSAFALLALRRTLWQLALLASAIAVAVGMLSVAPGVLPIWLLLAPASALLVHHRDALRVLFRSTARRDQRAIPTRRRSPHGQASRRSESLSRRRLQRPAHPLQHVR